MTGTACESDICSTCQEVLVWLPSRDCYACQMARLDQTESPESAEAQKEVPHEQQ